MLATSLTLTFGPSARPGRSVVFGNIRGNDKTPPTVAPAFRQSLAQRSHNIRTSHVSEASSVTVALIGREGSDGRARKTAMIA